jgi:hypothetical protein
MCDIFTVLVCLGICTDVCVYIYTHICTYTTIHTCDLIFITFLCMCTCICVCPSHTSIYTGSSHIGEYLAVNSRSHVFMPCSPAFVEPPRDWSEEYTTGSDQNLPICIEHVLIIVADLSVFCRVRLPLFWVCMKGE